MLSFLSAEEGEKKGGRRIVFALMLGAGEVSNAIPLISPCRG